MGNSVLIHLDNTVFVGGDVVTGELEVKIDAALPVRGVRVLFHGYETCYWSRGAGRIRSSGTGRLRATHSETRDLFREEITLFGDPPLDTAALISDSLGGLFNSGHYHTLEPGNYRYPFSYTLPDQLPGDYEDSANRSKIRYLVKGYLDIPLKIDVEQVVPLTMLEVCDRNAEHPVFAANEKSLFESGTFVKMQAALDKSMFLPGETLDCRLMVENQSGKPVQAVRIALQKLETLSAEGASSTNIEEVLTTRYEASSIPAGETAERNLQIAIPGNLYPTIVSSQLLKVQYRLVVALEIPWASGLEIPWAMDLDVEVPIILVEEKVRTGNKNTQMQAAQPQDLS